MINLHAPPPGEVLTYAGLLAEKLLKIADAEVIAVHLHGSAALGGWRKEVSDVDALVILAQDVAPAVARALAQAAVSTLSACPGTGLEMTAVSRFEAATPQLPWRFVVHVAGGPHGPPTIVYGDGHLGDPDLLLHYAVCRTIGWPVIGPLPSELIGPVRQAAVLEALSQELIWALQHAPAQYALLNSCRALVYLREDELVAKTTGGQWALDQGVGPADGIRRALSVQAGSGSVAAVTNLEVDFIQQTARDLSVAAEELHDPMAELGP